jgi:hypothetical protein
MLAKLPKKRYLQPLLHRAVKLTGKHPDTIRRWAKSGLNLSDTAAVLEWNKTHRNRRSGKPAKRLSLNILNKLPAPDERGAVGALARLQRLEILFHERLDQEIRKGGDPAEVSAASADYTRLTESLRKYEKEVEMARRDLGHLIPKGDAVDAIRAAATWLRLTWMQWISSGLEDVRAASPDISSSGKKSSEVFYLTC